MVMKKVKLNNLSSINHQFAVNLKDPRASYTDIEQVRIKKLNVTFIRNDELPIFSGLSYSGNLLDLDDGLRLDVGYQGSEYIFDLVSTDSEHDTHGQIYQQQLVKLLHCYSYILQ